MIKVNFSRGTRFLAVASLGLGLAACSTSAPDNISLAPPDGAAAGAIVLEKQQPGCSGECPGLRIDIADLSGQPRLATLVDHALALMTWLDSDSPAPYDNLRELEEYYWERAASRDQIHLSARILESHGDLSVLELLAGVYQTGMAHGVNGSQLLNWDRASQKALTLEQLLEPGALPAFQDLLKKSHEQWLLSHASDVDDLDMFRRMWPFVTSDNAALLSDGLLVKYQPYEIAPYAWGQPELIIPRAQLAGIIRSEYLR